MTAMQNPTACVIVIGNEILSGRTKDKNLVWLAEQLNILGIRLMEARVIPDIEHVIVATLRECSDKFTYVFSTGGIGPTHDDITAACVAKMAGVPLAINEDARQRLIKHYGGEEHVNEARLRMATVPEGATLILNPVSGAPGFQIRNIYVMAGVPSIMQAMFDSMKHTLVGGEPMLSRTLSAYVTEGIIAKELGEIQTNHMKTDIGSYPFSRDGKLGTSIVTRSTDTSAMDAATEAVHALLSKHADVTEE
jgi:molybdenum cofactor synthesis domain-containing protein